MTDASAARFGSARETIRSEDLPLLTGRGRYADDIRVAGEAHAAFLRSPHANARIVRLDTVAAKAAPGVLAVVTGADLAVAGIGPIPCAVPPAPGRDGKPYVQPPRLPMPAEFVRYVGEPLAMVVAETLAQAQDAVELIEADFTELPAVVDPDGALAPGAHAIWEAAPGNLCWDWETGDAAAVEAAFAKAAHIVTGRLLDTRVAPAAMENRSGVATYDAATGRFTLRTNSQGVFLMRRMLAESVLRIEPAKLQVITEDVGGGFGMKAQTYSEHALVLIGARATGRPVRWTNTRADSFATDTAGRDSVLEGRMALDRDGKVLALAVDYRIGIGAYVTTFAPVFTTTNTTNCLASVYRTPAIHARTRLVFTNTAPLGPYRGAGRPEAIWMVEHLLDRAAAKLGVDRAEIRRRNLIRPEEMPWKTPVGRTYDSGDFPGALDKALKLADWQGFAARRRQSEAQGKLRGIGLCCFLEIAGGTLEEAADLRFGADGKAALHIGGQPMGQGLVTAFRRIVARRLGIGETDVRIVFGDSDVVPAGTPSVASRTTMMAGGAGANACDVAIERGRCLAAHLLEAAEADIEFSTGTYRVTGTDRTLPLLELAAKVRAMGTLPSGLEPLDNAAKFVSPDFSFPNGCHICEVEIDRETGTLAVVGYAAVDDVGNVVSETIVDGQVHGGIAQGLGQVIGEQIIYDEAGQLVTGTFMDYQMPRAADLPAIRTEFHSVPCTTNPLGVKGAGESGVAGSLPSGHAAVLDALASAGAGYLDLPATPSRIWAALNAATS